MAVRSAGILLHRRGAAGTEVLIAHMGGPFWSTRDEGAWSIPKGEFDPDAEAALDAARREFVEELGVPAPPGPYTELGSWAYSSGKRVTVFAADGDGVDPTMFVYGRFELEWPPRSGRMRSFPEVDRAGWFDLVAARPLLVKGQRPALDALAARMPDR